MARDLILVIAEWWGAKCPLPLAHADDCCLPKPTRVRESAPAPATAHDSRTDYDGCRICRVTRQVQRPVLQSHRLASCPVKRIVPQRTRTAGSYKVVTVRECHTLPRRQLVTPRRPISLRINPEIQRRRVTANGRDNSRSTLSLCLPAMQSPRGSRPLSAMEALTTRWRPLLLLQMIISLRFYTVTLATWVCLIHGNSIFVVDKHQILPTRLGFLLAQAVFVFTTSFLSASSGMVHCFCLFAPNHDAHELDRQIALVRFAETRVSSPLAKSKKTLRQHRMAAHATPKRLWR